MTLSQEDPVNQYLINTEVVVTAGLPVTVRKHPELDELSEYDTKKLTEVIVEYNKWYHKHDLERHRQQKDIWDMKRWESAIFAIKDIFHENMEVALSTLEETVWVAGEYRHFPVQKLFERIDSLREELTEPPEVLLQYKPVFLMDILNDLQTYTRRVIQNTSIQRLHKKSWVHADLLQK